jgi:RimJ/RimL family protein N-acetyltransferase
MGNHPPMTNIVPAKPRHFAALISGEAAGGLTPAPGGVAPPQTLDMLAKLAAKVGRAIQPSAWLIVEDGEIVGLVSIIRFSQGAAEIGYGIAPARQGRGSAGRAVAGVLAWAEKQPHIARITADTSVTNIASQRVLEANGFRRVGERQDEEDGALLCWSRDVSGIS